MRRLKTTHRFVILAALALALAAGPALAQTKLKPGFNLFSVEQDVELGRQSAAEVERQMPILQDRNVQQYVSAVGQRLAAVSGSKFPFQFKVVNVGEINAFALPGGFMYVNRGLLEAVKNEGQLAGVMAHEMSHVVLRHGTNQASKAYLGQAGLGVLGGLLGKGGSSAGRTINAVGGVGMNVLFLKFSRTDEEQADVLGSQIMARAGYNPQDMVDFFEMLRGESKRDPGRVEQFLSDHPAPANRAARIKQEMKSLTINPKPPVGRVDQIQARLRGMPKAPTAQQVAKNRAVTGQSTSSVGTARLSDVSIARPAGTYRTFEQRNGFFKIDYPENWRVYEPASGYGFTIAPEGGLVDAGGPERSLVYGVVINHYDPFGTDSDDDRFGDRGAPGSTFGSAFREGSAGMDASRTDLAEATRDVLNQIVRANPYLKLVQDSAHTDTVDSEPALSAVLSGRSPITQDEERVTVFTRRLTDGHVIYAVFVAPGKDYRELSGTFDRMISSLRVNDEGAHR